MVAIDETQLRASLAVLMSQTVSDQQTKGNWRYEAVRPQVVAIHYIGQIIVVDCSDGCRMLCYSAGVADDPAGNNYETYGNSSSIWVHLHHIDLSEAKVGDIITFGKYAGELHACMIYDLTDPTNPKVWNMGAPGQPWFSTLAIEEGAHQGAVYTVCQLNLPADPPPTPQEKLREMTGFYSWVAWRLGEGPWKTYGKTNSTVRPSVPKVIPLTWWKHLAKFLLARKKGNNPVKPKKNILAAVLKIFKKS